MTYFVSCSANYPLQKGGGYRVIFYIAECDDFLLVAVYSKTEQHAVNAGTIARLVDEADPATPAR